MNCQDCMDRHSAYLDHELGEPETRDIQTHLGHCEACRNQLRLMEQIADAARDLPRHTPSAACLLKISETIHRRAVPPRRTDFGPVLSFDELAEYLRVDRDIVGQYLDEIPSFEMGGKLLFRKTSVDAWIENKEAGPGFQATEKAGIHVRNYVLSANGAQRHGHRPTHHLPG